MSPVFTRAETRLGFAAVMASGTLFSAKSVLIKLSYGYGVEPATLMTLRMLFCLPFFLGMALVPGLNGKGVLAPLGRRDLAGIGALGLLGYYLASIFDLSGLQYVSAGMERMILFVYPTLVVLLSAWLFRKPIGRSFILPLILSYAGIALSFGGEALGGGGSRIHLGAFLIFLSALSYALFLVLQGRIIHRVGPQRLTSHAMLVSSAAVLAHFAVFHPLADLDQPGPVYLLALVMAVFTTVLPAYLLGYGIQRIGTGRAAIVSSVGPVSTVVLAAWLLDEKAGFLQIAGLMLVVGGSLLLGAGKDRGKADGGVEDGREVKRKI